jgi:hypothetical protein
VEKVGFLQKGAPVSHTELDDMMRLHVDPSLAEVFLYTRAWLQEVAARSIGRSVDQIKTARQMDIPARLAIPMRVISCGRRRRRLPA